MPWQDPKGSADLGGPWYPRPWRGIRRLPVASAGFSLLSPPSRRPLGGCIFTPENLGDNNEAEFCTLTPEHLRQIRARRIDRSRRRRACAGQSAVNSSIQVNSFSLRSYLAMSITLKRPPVFCTSGLLIPTLGYPARSPTSWRRRSEFPFPNRFGP